MTSEEEFIRVAQLDWADEQIETIKDALEACYINGSYDDVGGDVEAPTGHYYRIEHWVVTMDDQNNIEVHTFDNEDDAEKHFDNLEKDFDEWNDENSA